MNREHIIHIHNLAQLALAIALSATIILPQAGSAIAAGQSASEDKSLSEQLVDTFNVLAGGSHSGYRANHAKGIVTTGTFAPAKTAASVSKAPHLQRTTVPMTVRFSDATGVPNIPDADPNTSPHGIAIRFELPNGGYTDIVGISYDGFPVATPEDFLTFLKAIAASGPDAPKPTPVEQFLGSHPETLRFATTPKPAPVSFATAYYYGVNAFRFTNAKGISRYGRYRIVPLAGEHHLNDADAAKQPPNYLMDELGNRLTKGAVKFRLMVQLAKKGDPINDPTVTWPEDRPQVELGILTIKAPVADNDAAQKTLAFNPLILVDGIEPSNDPILLARPGAYAVSVGRRNQ